MLLAVTNRHLCREPFLERIEKIAKEQRADYLLLREKDLEHEQYVCLAEECKKILEPSSVRLVLHSDVEAALELSIDAIHLPFSLFREKFLAMPQKTKERFTLVGVSVHSVEEAVFVENHGGSYVTAGHIFATDCKKGVPPRGLEFLKEVCQSVSIPVYAIGGIDETKMEEVMQAGAFGGAVMSGFMQDKKDNVTQKETCK